MNYKSLLYEIQNASIQGPTVDTIIVPSNILLYNVNLDTREIDAPEYLSVQHEHYAETVYFLVDRYYDNMDLAQTTCVIQYVTPDGESYVYAVPFCDTVTYSGGIKDENGKDIDDQPKMIIPWCISGSATKLSGTVKYIIRFYKIDEASVHPHWSPFHKVEQDTVYDANVVYYELNQNGFYHRYIYTDNETWIDALTNGHIYTYNEHSEDDEYDPSNAAFSYSLSTKPASSRVLYGLPIEGVLDDESYHVETNNRFYELLSSIGQMVDNATLYWIDV